MFKALYDYKTNLARYLSFQAGDEFTLLENANKDWFLAQNGFGEIGYVPKNYMAKEDVRPSATFHCRSKLLTRPFMQ